MPHPVDFGQASYNVLALVASLIRREKVQTWAVGISKNCVRHLAQFMVEWQCSIEIIILFNYYK